MGLGPVGIGAGQQHEHVGPGGEGAPGLDPVDQPTAFGGHGRGDHAGHVGAEVGLGDRHRPHHLGGGQPGQPVLLLLLGAPVDQGPGEDLGPGDQGPAGAQRAPRQLLGGHHHAHVVGLAAGGEPPVLLGHRHAEAAHLGHPEMISSGMSVLARWMCSARGRICSSANRWKVSRTSSKSASRWRVPGRSAREARKAGSRKVATNASAGAIHPAATPHSGAAPDDPGGQVGHGVGGEGAGDPGLGVAVGPVGQDGLGRSDGGGGVGDVVGQHLGRVGTAGSDQGGDAGIDDRLGQTQCVGGGRRSGAGRGSVVTFQAYRPGPARPNRPACSGSPPASTAKLVGPDRPCPSQRAVRLMPPWRCTCSCSRSCRCCLAPGRQRRRTDRWPPHHCPWRPRNRGPQGDGAWATTVTRGGSTTGSSPGSTSVSSLR